MYDTYRETDGMSPEELRQEGLRRRLGFDPEQAVKFHVAGVTFEDRQRVLKDMKSRCTWGFTPPVKLRRADQEIRDRHDPHAIEVIAGVRYDDLTDEWSMQPIGFVPRRGCAACGTNFGKSFLEQGCCPNCQSTNLYSPNELLDANDPSRLVCGIDNVIEPQSHAGPLGCVVYVKVERI